MFLEAERLELRTVDSRSKGFNVERKSSKCIGCLKWMKVSEQSNRGVKRMSLRSRASAREVKWVTISALRNSECRGEEIGAVVLLWKSLLLAGISALEEVQRLRRTTADCQC
jgi:hypothetical protein